jgi:Tat protein secretion system quality control protein TatD with DNase activity
MSIDSHAHLEMKEFDADRDAVVGRAAAAGLSAIITVGTTIPDCEKVAALARRYPQVYAAVGIHPHEVKGIDAGTYDVLRELARQRRWLPSARSALIFSMISLRGIFNFSGLSNSSIWPRNWTCP